MKNTIIIEEYSLKQLGTVYHWDIDWDMLKFKGIAETLLEPRGASALDKYVADSIGVKFDSIQGQKFSDDVLELSVWTFMQFLHDKSKSLSVDFLTETMQAMFLFGMVYEMERLGMK